MIANTGMAAPPVGTPQHVDGKLLARFAIREGAGLFFMGVILFWSAGALAWWPAWAALAVTAGWVVGTAVVILRHSPGLLAERLGPRRGAKQWDMAILSVHGILNLGALVVAGLDHRYGWSATVPLAAQVAALVVCAVGYALVVWATAANAFFSQVVRIQTERRHSVVTGGPYHFVRHPAYIGGILTQIALPILLGSWWALVLGVADSALMVLRTALEDRTLHAELPGYREYAARVRQRLIPGLW